VSIQAGREQSIARQAKKRALIVGSGVAGVTAAHALLQIDWDVTVYEKATDVRALYVGSGIHLWNNTMRAMKMLGLEDRVATVSGPGAVVEHMKFFTPKGRLLADVKAGQFGRKIGGDCIGVNRAELLPSLAEALPEGVIQTSNEFASYEQDDEGVTLRLADGREQRGDILVGADGLHSSVRRAILGGLESPRYAGYTIWQGIITKASTELAPLGDFPLVYGAGLRFCYYRVDDDRLYWFAVSNADEGGTDGPGVKEKLKETFRGWMHPVEAIIDATAEDVIHRRDLYDRDPIKTWGDGRVTLIGDAAHPMTFDIGQGAGQGIEDAVVLKRCLSQTDDVVAAFRSYEQQRQPRTAHMQKLSRNVGKWGRWKHPMAVAVRNVGTRLTLGNPIAVKQFEKDLAYDF
jgi:2-polyprenyl-6-methoxyphenol hydroxylase-like FAD-dependent oxidoreductase